MQYAYGEPISYAPLTYSYVRTELSRSPNVANPYALKTKWGEKMFVNGDPEKFTVLNVPPDTYKSNSASL